MQSKLVYFVDERLIAVTRSLQGIITPYITHYITPAHQTLRKHAPNTNHCALFL